jgi:hypothetical protein
MVVITNQLTHDIGFRPVNYAGVGCEMDDIMGGRWSLQARVVEAICKFSGV